MYKIRYNIALPPAVRGQDNTALWGYVLMLVSFVWFMLTMYVCSPSAPTFQHPTAPFRHMINRVRLPCIVENE